MTEPATFDEDDWAALSGADKKALRILSNYGFNTISPDPLARAAGVGAKSMESLIQKGLAVETESGLHGRYFKMTDKGTLAQSWLMGHKIRVYPSN